MKTCTKCRVEKDLAMFSPSKRGLHGVQSTCKQCYAEIRRQYYKANPEKYKQVAKMYAKENYGKVLERNNRYRQSNPEKLKEWKRKDRQKNKARILSDNALRRSMTKGSNSPEIVQIYALRDFYIAMSMGESFHVDHIIPVSKGGAHAAWNLQVIPAIDNLRKGDK